MVQTILVHGALVLAIRAAPCRRNSTNEPLLLGFVLAVVAEGCFSDPANGFRDRFPDQDECSCAPLGHAVRSPVARGLHPLQRRRQRASPTQHRRQAADPRGRCPRHGGRSQARELPTRQRDNRPSRPARSQQDLRRTEPGPSSSISSESLATKTSVGRKQSLTVTTRARSCASRPSGCGRANSTRPLGNSRAGH